MRILDPNILRQFSIVITILTLLFLFQRLGTKIVGGSFGPFMLVWFLVLGFLGATKILEFPGVLIALSPVYAIKFLTEYPGGFWLLGAVFLCTTGAEALYSDLGHCGRGNIRVSWTFVKTCLVLNYFGQGAFLMLHEGQTISGQSPFIVLCLFWFLALWYYHCHICGTIIASQALISGSFTLISEAMRLEPVA